MPIAGTFRSFWSRRLWWVIAVICVLGGVLWSFRPRGDPFEPIVARVRARRQPTTWADLERQFPFNALAYSNYLQSVEIGEHLHREPAELHALWEKRPPADSTDRPRLTIELVAAAKAWLSRYSATLDQLMPTLEGPSNFGYRKEKIDARPFPQPGPVFEGFWLRAALAYERGDAGASVADIVAALKWTRRQPQGFPQMGLHVNRLRCLALLVEPMLLQHDLSAPQMEQLEVALTEMLDTPSFHTSLRWYWVELIEGMRRERSQVLLEPGWLKKGQLFFYAISGRKLSDYSVLLEVEDELAEVFAGPMSQCRTRAQAFDKRCTVLLKRAWDPGFRATLASTRSSPYLVLLEREMWGQGWLRTMAATLAVERFRRLHGHLPAKLEEAYPADRAWALVDPNDGQLLRYRKTDSGYLIYSVGVNGIDDGGRPGGIPNGSFTSPWQGDITMEMSLEPGDPR